MQLQNGQIQVPLNMFCRFCDEADHHTSRFGSPSLPVVIVKCPVIPYHVGKFLGLMKYIIFFLRIKNPRMTTATAFNKSMAEVNCVSLNDIRTFCHATRFRFSHKILKVLSVDSLLFLSELHLTLQIRFNFKESRL